MTAKNGLFINYDFCTGCHSCEIACRRALGLGEGEFGIKLLQDGPRQNPDGSWEYTYLPLPTHLCDLCATRTQEGRLPMCVHHCQARVMEYGPCDELVKLLDEHPRSMIVEPR